MTYNKISSFKNRKGAFILAFFVLSFLFSSNVFASSGYWAIIDDHNKKLPNFGEYYNEVGGDRGLLNEGQMSYWWNGDSVYTVKTEWMPGSWTWGGMWYSLNGINRDNVPLDFKAIYGPYVKSEHQGEITEVEIKVNSVVSPLDNPYIKLRVELKDSYDRMICSKTWQPVTPATYKWALPEQCKREVKLILWIIDMAVIGDSVSVDRVRLKTQVPELSTEEQAFLWTYSWLMSNYDASTGMVQDRSNFGVGDFENITATAKTAKIVYYAYKKGYTEKSDAEAIITKIADTLINTVPRGPSGINSLWPHFTRLGGTQIVPDTEWASGDTAYAVLDIITALEMIGDPQNQLADLENFAKDIDWQDLMLSDASISHGYKYDGSLIPYGWAPFGMENIGVNWAYASATGRVVPMYPPPTYNGSGFIENAHYPIALTGLDRWGYNWDDYRNNTTNTQIGWYCDLSHYNQFLCDSELFGLSAAEPPEGNDYQAYGIGGMASYNDGDSEVIVLHYSAMISDIRIDKAKGLWQVLRDKTAGFIGDNVIISPLNNMESMRVDKNNGEIVVNHLKGSWNLSLQAEGWAMADPLIRDELESAILNNSFLYSGYTLLKLAGDVNGDCRVNILDMVYIRNNIGKDPNSSISTGRSDVNSDGKINILDFVSVRNKLGKRCQ